MKIGDYLRAKSSFTRDIYSSVIDKNTREVSSVTNTGQISVTKNSKYKITNIFNSFETELVELTVNDTKVCYSLNQTPNYELLLDFFTEDIAKIRLEKINQLNELISDIELYLYE